MSRPRRIRIKRPLDRMTPKNDKLPATATLTSELREGISRIVRGENSDPFWILGPHWVDANAKREIVVRAFSPSATSFHVIWMANGAKVEGKKVDDAGFFEATLPEAIAKPLGDKLPAASTYKLHFQYADGNTFDSYDPYAFPTVLTEYDLYLSAEGTNY